MFYLGTLLGLKVKSLWLYVQHSSSHCRLPSAVTYATLHNSATVRPSGLGYLPLQQGGCQQPPPSLNTCSVSQLGTRPSLRVTHRSPVSLMCRGGFTPMTWLFSAHVCKSSLGCRRMTNSFGYSTKRPLTQVNISKKMMTTITNFKTVHNNHTKNGTQVQRQGITLTGRHLFIFLLLLFAFLNVFFLIN